MNPFPLFPAPLPARREPPCSARRRCGGWLRRGLAAVDIRPQVGRVDADRSSDPYRGQLALIDEVPDRPLGHSQQFTGIAVGQQVFDFGLWKTFGRWMVSHAYVNA